VLDEQEVGSGTGDEGATHFVRGRAEQRAPDPDREADQQEDEDAEDGETGQAPASRVVGVRVTFPTRSDGSPSRTPA
jgi:hypothetical protein